MSTPDLSDRWKAHEEARTLRAAFPAKRLSPFPPKREAVPPPPRPGYNITVRRPGVGETVEVRLHDAFVKTHGLRPEWRNRWVSATISTHPDNSSLHPEWQLHGVPGVTFASSYSLYEWRPIPKRTASTAARPPGSRKMVKPRSTIPLTTAKRRATHHLVIHEPRALSRQ